MARRTPSPSTLDTVLEATEATDEEEIVEPLLRRNRTDGTLAHFSRFGDGVPELAERVGAAH